jgi:cobalamin biosynthesis Co2+ chelatase CbiK
MKKLLLIFTILSIISCTKEETVQPQKKQIVTDFKTELRKSNWTHYSFLFGEHEEWNFINDTTIQSTSNTTTRTYTYNIINDSFILKYKVTMGVSVGGVVTPFANLKLSNDTVYWKYYNMNEYKVFLIKTE